MISREKVYKVIDSEREYQQKRWYRDNKSGFHSVGGYITLIRRYSFKADEMWHNYGDQAALAQIRKVAALCLACMEENGFVARGGIKSSIADRCFIYQALDGECDYQEDEWRKQTNEVGAYLTALKSKIDETEYAWVNRRLKNDPNIMALDGIRMIAAVCIHCMEENGIVEREWENIIPE
jgi:hypothetical protein